MLLNMLFISSKDERFPYIYLFHQVSVLSKFQRNTRAEMTQLELTFLIQIQEDHQ